MRKDLNMRKGKMIAQGAHASLKVVVDALNEFAKLDSLPYSRSIPLDEWIRGKFTKICVSVDSEAELKEVYNKALQAGLLCALIEDSGTTEFHGVTTATCCAIGPAYPKDLDPITGHLKLL